MRFSDAIVQGATDIDAADIIGIPKVLGDAIEDDFGLITSEKAKAASEFAQEEVKAIVQEEPNRR